MLRTLLLASLIGLGQQAAASPQAVNTPESGAETSTPSQHAVQPSNNPPAPDDSRALQLSSPKPVAVPPFSSLGEAKCDSSGNMYFSVYAASHTGAILQISHDGTRSAVFVPPTPGKPDAMGGFGFRDFFVTQSGKIYELLQNRNDQNIVVIEFDSDGSVRHTMKPETSEDLQARSIAVFEDGTFLLQGYIRFKPGEGASRNYVALFDGSGQLRKELTGFPDFDVDVQSKTVENRGLADRGRRCVFARWGSHHCYLTNRRSLSSHALQQA
jgi:hypothetical protein